MQPLPLHDEDWEYVRTLLPADLEESARKTNALQRCRNVPDAAALIRMALAYAVSDLSLKDVAAWASALEVVQITGPGLFYRLREAEGWLEHVLATEEMDLEQVRKLLEEARSGNLKLESTTLEYTLRLTIENLFERFSKEPPDPARIERLEAIIETARKLPFDVVLWTAQNVWAAMRRTIYQQVSQRGQEGDEEARSWLHHFRSLGEKLGVRVNGAVTGHAETA